MYFYGLNLEPLVQGHLGPRELCLNKLCKEALGMQCYIQNFKHLSQEILKKNISEYFLCISMVQPRTLWQVPSWALGPLFEQIWLRTTRQYYKSNFKHLSQAVLEKKIFKIVSFFLTQDPLSQGHFGPQGYHLSKLNRGELGEEPQANATYQIGSI